MLRNHQCAHSTMMRQHNLEPARACANGVPAYCEHSVRSKALLEITVRKHSSKLQGCVSPNPVTISARPPMRSEVMIEAAPEPPIMLKSDAPACCRATSALKSDAQACSEPPVRPNVMVKHTPEPLVPMQPLFARMLDQACCETTSALTQQ